MPRKPRSKNIKPQQLELFESLLLFAQRGEVLPPWLVESLTLIFDDYLNGRIGDLGPALGVRFAKHAHVADQARDLTLGPRLIQAVKVLQENERLSRGEAIRRAGEKFSLSEGKARKLYYAERKILKL